MAASLISIVLEQLASITIHQVAEAFKLVSEVDEEVENLTSNLQAIQAVLEDAEMRHVKEKAVKNWLDNLKVVSYDIDDLLDEWNSPILKREIEQEATTDANVPLHNKVRSLILSSCFGAHLVVLKRDTALKIQEVNKRLAVIGNERSRYNFTTESKSCEQRNIITSVIDESEVFVKEENRKTIKDMLLSESGEETPNLRIISVVGMGGIGKTTLTRLAFNEPNVERYFENRIWVCVSDPFGEERISEEILESLLGTKPDLVGKNNVQLKISELVSGKKILLVLDDVWTEDSCNWEQSKGSLQNSSPKSRILVTIRKEMVGKALGSRSKDFLFGKLSEDKCWSLFFHLEFFERTRVECENLEDTGRKIAEKCKGLPLAVKTLGGLLRFKAKESGKLSILDRKMWEIEEVEKGVLSPLLLSYYDLSPGLRRCFSYCAIFAKDYKIEKDELIKLWMAQGFVKEIGNKGVEVIGEEYFNTLAMRSFFQDFKTYGDEKIYCKTHDLVHHFAQFLTEKESFFIEFDGEQNSWKNPSLKTIHHSMLMFEREGVKFPIPMDNWKELRSLLINTIFLRVDSTSAWNLLNSVIDQLTCLRALDFGVDQFCGPIKRLSDKIGKLIHLRYLNHLPCGIGKLINLVYLENEGTHLRFVPKGTRLQTVKDLVVSNRGLRIQELGKPSHLQGDLGIRGLGNVADTGEAREARLSAKAGLRKLALVFGSHEETQPIRKENEAFVLEALQSPPNLETSMISYLNGPTLFPNWIIPLNMLKSVTLTGCSKWESLPSMGKLPSLEYLLIRGMNKVKRVGEEFLGIEREALGQTFSSSFSSSSSVTFPNLRSLEFYGLKKWEEWKYENISRSWGVHDDSSVITIIMLRLQSKRIGLCPKLTALPRHHLQNTATIQELRISFCPILEQHFEKETGQDWPFISRIPHITITKEKGH